MQCCKGKDELVLHADCNECVNHGGNHMKQASTICLCRNNGGCFISTNCNVLRPSSPATTCTYLEPCQCAEEIEWNCYTPPKPSCKWLNIFCKLRRQWSNHARQQNCRCCHCKLR